MLAWASTLSSFVRVHPKTVGLVQYADIVNDKDSLIGRRPVLMHFLRRRGLAEGSGSTLERCDG